MKHIAVAVSVFALMIGFGAAAHAEAEANSYTPPERIHCILNNANQLMCHDFNRTYLSEDVHNLNIPANQDLNLVFHSAAAYFSSRKDSVSVFFTYGSPSRYVRLRTIGTVMGPDVKYNKNWQQTDNSTSIYRCASSYLNCSIKKVA